eukprot:2209526-Prymnesium_polylepis.3
MARSSKNRSSETGRRSTTSMYARGCAQTGSGRSARSYGCRGAAVAAGAAVEEGGPSGEGAAGSPYHQDDT